MLKYAQYHFVGVAGVGMSAVAQAVVFGGFRATGSDRDYDRGTELAVLRQLKACGVGLYGQDGAGVYDGAEAVVVSTAIEADNPDLVAARELGLPVLHRSEILAELVADSRCLAVAGTSGKSTVAGMVGWILEQAGLDPCVVNGAPVINWQTDECIGNARAGNGGLWVIEADESDRSLINYHPLHAVVTNMSADHFALDETVALFKEFRATVRGGVIGALDGSQYLGEVDSACGPGGSKFVFRGVEFELQLPGAHNVEDALHATMLAELVGVEIAESAAALRSFRGIHRRLEVVGRRNGITVIDDYGHNPAKIAAAWRAVVPYARRGIVVWRPHGYGPLRAMLEDLTNTFGELCCAEDLLLLLPVYDAGGSADRSINSDALVERLRTQCVGVIETVDYDAVISQVRKGAAPGDVVMVMGARDPLLPQLARRILTELPQG
jgi:UDP-N-acetylmuramate--alanine ligase